METAVRRTPRATVTAAVLGAGAVAWVAPCPLHAATGLWCPLCGSTRAVRAFAHGRVSDVFRYNALLPVACVAVAVFAFVSLTPGASARVPKSALWVGLAVVVVFAVARNLPGLAILRPPR